MGLGVCVLAAPEIIVGAVIVAGGVVVGFALKEALDTYAEKKGRPQVGPVPETRPVPEPESFTSLFKVRLSVSSGDHVVQVKSSFKVRRERPERAPVTRRVHFESV